MIRGIQSKSQRCSQHREQRILLPLSPISEKRNNTTTQHIHQGPVFAVPSDLLRKNPHQQKYNILTSCLSLESFNVFIVELISAFSPHRIHRRKGTVNAFLLHTVTLVRAGEDSIAALRGWNYSTLINVRVRRLI